MDVEKVQRMISCTGLNVDLDSIDFQTRLEKIVGLSVATSDLLGQMAARDYVDRLADLYKEFTECWEYAGDRACWSLHYESIESLLEKTPGFWDNYVKHKLDIDCLGLYKFLNYPYPDGPNDYLLRIEANIDKVRRINDRRYNEMFPTCKNQARTANQSRSAHSSTPRNRFRGPRQPSKGVWKYAALRGRPARRRR